MPLTDIATVTVEASWSTNPDDTPVWVPIVPVERVTLGKVGRTYELDSVNPARGTIAVDNTDGAYSSGAPISGGTVTTDKRIRVTAVLTGAATYGVPATWGGMSTWGMSYTLADHIIESCPTTLDSGGFDYASSAFTTIDYMDALGIRTLASALIEQTLFEKPLAYFTLGEAAGSTTVGDQVAGALGTIMSGNTAGHGGASAGAAALGGAPFYVATDPTTNLALTADTTGGHYLQLANAGGGVFLTGSVWAFRVVFAVGPTFGGQILHQPNPDPSTGAFSPISLSVSTSGVLTFAAPGTAGLTSAAQPSGAAWNDGAAHMALVLCNGTNTLVYLDGLLSATLAATTAASLQSTGTFALGAVVNADATVSNALTGQVGHVALFGASHAITDPTTSHSAALGFAGEYEAARIGRVLSWAGWTGATALDTGATPLAAQACSGNTAAAELLATATAEDGIFYISPAGTPAFRSRKARYAVASLVTLGTTALPVDTSRLTFDYDRQHMVNDMLATRPNGPTIRVRDATSVAAHRTRNVLGGATMSFAVTTDAELVNAANWYLYRYSEPRARVGTVRINPYTTPALAYWACTLQPFDRITITGLPSNAPAPTMEFLVESVGHPQIDNGDWVCELSLSPFIPVWTIGDPVYGVIGTAVLAH